MGAGNRFDLAKVYSIRRVSSPANQKLGQRLKVSYDLGPANINVSLKRSEKLLDLDVFHALLQRIDLTLQDLTMLYKGDAG